MSIINFQRSRIAAALRSILRAATGRDISPSEIGVRTAAYLSAPSVYGLGPTDSPVTNPPLFLASDYKPTSDQDPLGGPDGRDISRAWAAVREDFDTVDEALTEAERRLEQARTLIRTQDTILANKINASLLSASSVQQQTQTLFFGGAGGPGASGRGSNVWSVGFDGLVYPETTAIVLPGDLGCLPNSGQPALSGTGTDTGSTIASVKLISSSDTTMMMTQQNRAWAESPLSTGNAAWTFSSTNSNPATVNMKFITNRTVGAIELQVSQGTTVVGLTQINTGAKVSYSPMKAGSSLWLILNTPIAGDLEVQLSLLGIPDSNGVSYIGSVTQLQAYTFSYASEGSFVWGPFSSSSENSDALYTVSISNVVASIPTGSNIDYSISTLSADGPWTSIPAPNSPLLLSSSGREEIDLLPSQAKPDTLSIGYFLFPLSSQASLYGAVFSAGNEQAQVSAYYYDWNAQVEAVHNITPNDWAKPNGTPQTVAMGASPFEFQGDLLQQGYPSSSYMTSNTPMSRYFDKNGVDLVYINLKGNDNSWTLQPGYNYRFQFSLWTPSAAYLPNIPVGIINPNGGAGLLSVPLLITLNKTTVFQGNSTFSDYNELTDPPTNLGQVVSDYPAIRQPGSGAGQQYQGSGISWPPNAGRMNLTLTAGWNTLTVYTAIPASNSQVNANLQPWAGIVFGPNLFADPTTRYNSTGIQLMRGWADPWTQLSEFDLRQNTPIGMQNVWAWSVDPATGNTQGILINHDPSASETGFLTLDNVMNGQARNHHISYLTQSAGSSESLIPGQDPQSRNLWVRARLTTTQPSSGPFLKSLQLNVN